MNKLIIDIFDLDLDIEAFDYSEYYKGETEILTPALLNAGYVLVGSWYSSDSDSFGPLVRSIKVLTPEQEKAEVFYG